MLPRIGSISHGLMVLATRLQRYVSKDEFDESDPILDKAAEGCCQNWEGDLRDHGGGQHLAERRATI
jgi:hypothetical protein